MGVYVKTPTGKSQLRTKVTSNDIKTALGYTPANPDNIVVPDAEVTAESITEALGYVPADKNSIPKVDLSDIESNDDVFYIVDQHDNIIARVDAEGLHVIDVKVGKMLDGVLDEKSISQLISEAIKTVEVTGVDLSNYYNKEQVDSKIPSLEGYAKTSDIPSLDGYAKTSDVPSTDGLASKSYVDAIKKSISEEIVAEEEEFHIVDAQGNIVATIDADGLRTTTVNADQIILAGKILSNDTSSSTYVASGTGTSGTFLTDLGYEVHIAIETTHATITNVVITNKGKLNSSPTTITAKGNIINIYGFTDEEDSPVTVTVSYVEAYEEIASKGYVKDYVDEKIADVDDAISKTKTKKVVASESRVLPDATVDGWQALYTAPSDRTHTESIGVSGIIRFLEPSKSTFIELPFSTLWRGMRMAQVVIPLCVASGYETVNGVLTFTAMLGSNSEMQIFDMYSIIPTSSVKTKVTAVSYITDLTIYYE